MITSKLKISLLFLIAYLWLGCNPNYTPRPKDYPYIDLPEKIYREYNSEECPFTFEYPVYAEVVKDSFFFNEPIKDPCWLNIRFPGLNATIYISYKPIGEEYSLQKLADDAYRLTFKHAERADYIEPETLETPNGVYGLMYFVGGNAASSTQFFLTDTVSHFLRGALYFGNEPNVDSLAPAIKFVNEDIMHLIETLRWKNS